MVNGDVSTNWLKKTSSQRFFSQTGTLRRRTTIWLIKQPINHIKPSKATLLRCRDSSAAAVGRLPPGLRVGDRGGRALSLSSLPLGLQHEAKMKLNYAILRP